MPEAVTMTKIIGIVLKVMTRRTRIMILVKEDATVAAINVLFVALFMEIS